MIGIRALISAICGAMLLTLLAAGSNSFASGTEATDSRSVIRPNAKCAKANAKITVVVKGQTLQCRKGKSGYFWRVVKNATSTEQRVQAMGPFQQFTVVPEGGSNALFTMNQRFLPELAQTVTLTQPISLESLILDPRCITLVPLDYYSGPNQNHSLEQFTCNYPSIESTITTSIYKIGDQFTGVESRLFISNLTPVYTAKSQQNIQLESPLTVRLDPAIRLDPGYYAVVFGFELTDPNINTIWFHGHQHVDGPQPACVSDPRSDIYSTGSAYRGEPSTPYTGLADNFRGLSNLFILHTAKVQSCIVVGNYTDDIFANGDLNMKLGYRAFLG